jgi:TonB family protein
MNTTRLSLGVVLLIACITHESGGATNEDSHLSASQSDVPKKGWEYFPNRDDLPRNSDFTKSPSFKPPYPLRQPEPKLPLNLPHGHYRLSIVFVMEADGAVRDAVVAKSSGVAALDAACIAMIKKWKFSPTQVNGKGIATASILPMEFDQ